MTEIFKTNIQKLDDADRIIEQLLEHFTTAKINFDLEDSDKILRIENDCIDIEKIIEIVKNNNFKCEVLE